LAKILLGSSPALNGQTYRIVGVLSPGLGYFSRPVDHYMPLEPAAGNSTDRSRHQSMRVLGLLEPGVTLAAR
jgi:hypothetical protein